MAPTPDVPDPVRLAEAEGAAIRPTRVLFGLIVTIAAFLGIVPIYVNFLSPDAWQVTAANDRDRFDRIFTDTYMATAAAGVLVAWLGSVYFFRRSLRKALHGCAPKGRGPNGLAETASVLQRSRPGPPTAATKPSLLFPCLSRKARRVSSAARLTHQRAIRYQGRIRGGNNGRSRAARFER